MAGNLWARIGAVVVLAFVSGPPIARAQTMAAVPSEARVTVHVDAMALPAVLETIAKAASLHLIYDRHAVPAEMRVTLDVRNVPVADAFRAALRGTGLGAVISTTGKVALGRIENAAVPVSGTIIGKVTDAKTGQPLRGVKITIDGTNRAETADNGTYRASVSSGTHTIMVRMLGYTKVTRAVVVQDDATITVDVALESAVTPLDQVVVTGMVVATALKSVPNAITVITAKQIEERGITKIDQLFRGDVPGLFAQNQGSNPNALLDEVTMYSRGATALSGLSAGVDLVFLTNPIKTYLDGVELADPKYLSQIDPKSIERIEILTGPQASTIYGSNAINGVMQIFTKRGTTARPQLSLSLLSGWVENNLSSAHTAQHDYSAQLSGLEGRLAYNAGGSWNYMGPWTPAKTTTRTSGFGGARLEFPTAVGPVTADMTFRLGVTQNRQRGDPLQTNTGYVATGWYGGASTAGRAQPATSSVTGQTLGLVLGYTPTNWWTHELGIGQDASVGENRVTARGYRSLNDTTLQLIQTHTDRRSLHYTTTARVPVTSMVQATATVGADAWQSLTTSMSVRPQTLTGTLTNVLDVSRQPSHNAGGFVQTQLGVKDRLFLTYGLRAEWNPGFGSDAQPNYAPRYGVAYTQEMGAVSVKLRGSYGRSTRPPTPDMKVGVSGVEVYGGSDWSFYFAPYYDPTIDWLFANPDLTPEYQQGGEGGLELYLGTRGSLVITRYNQTVDGLIVSPVVDSVRSLVVCRNPCLADSRDASGYGYFHQQQNVNMGSIRNQGWELQGTLRAGPLTAHGTYSWTKSRAIGVNPKYRALFNAVSYPQYQPGASFRFLPEHTGAFGVTYANAATTIGLNVTGTGRVRNQADRFYDQYLISSIRLLQNRQSMNGNAYSSLNKSYAMADLTASHRFIPRVEGVLQVQNLTDHYTNDYSDSYATIGRQVKVGARIR